MQPIGKLVLAPTTERAAEADTVGKPNVVSYLVIPGDVGN